MRQFIDWLAGWTLAPRGMVLRMALRAPDEAGPEPVRVGVRRAGAEPGRMTPARSRALAALAEAVTTGETPTKRRLAEVAGCSVGVIDGLIDEGTLEAVALPPDPGPPSPDPDAAAPALDLAQAAAAAALVRAVDTQGVRRQPCSKVSPARARPRPISRPSRRRCG